MVQDARVARAVRWSRAQLPFLTVVLIVAVGFVYLLFASGHWTRSTATMAVGALVAGVLRLVLPTAKVGLLAVRTRWFDTLLYLALGGLMLGIDIRLHK